MSILLAEKKLNGYNTICQFLGSAHFPLAPHTRKHTSSTGRAYKCHFKYFNYILSFRCPPHCTELEGEDNKIPSEDFNNDPRSEHEIWNQNPESVQDDDLIWG